MFLTLDYKGFEENLIWRLESQGGAQYVYRFDNNYGAVVTTTKDERFKHNKVNVWEAELIRFKDVRSIWSEVDENYVGEVAVKYCDNDDILAFLNKVKGLL